MESVGSCGYDPDELDLEEAPARMANATLGQALNVVPRIKLSLISDLKELDRRYQNDERVRSRATTIKTAFMKTKHQAEKNGLPFGGLVTGPAHTGTLN